MELYAEVARACLAMGHKVAIISEKKQITYCELLDACTYFSEFLRSNGIEERDLVAIHCDNSIDYIVAYLAAAKLNLVVVPLDVRASTDELERIVRDCRPQLFIYDRDRPFLRTFGVTDAEPATTEHVSLRLCISRGGAYVACNEGLAESDFVIQYSSGSTGTPKGILLSQRGLLAKLDNWNRTLKNSHSDVFLNTLTLSHCYGLYVHSLAALLVGATLVMPSMSMLTPKRIALLIEQYKVTVFGSLPFMYQLLCDLPDGYAPEFSSVRYFISGSAPLNEKTAHDFYARFKRHLNQVFGLTEIGLITFNRDVTDPMSTGCLTHNMRARVLKEDGSECAEGEVGELVVQCESLSRGYLSNPDDQAAMFIDGWLYTKDHVYRSNGSFYVAGRKSQFINVGGNKVSPVEIEAALEAHAAVEEASAVGVSDEFRGQKVVAFLRAKSPVTVQELQEHCRAYLAPYKIPHKFYFVDELYKSPLGKVLKAKLVEKYVTNGEETADVH